MVRSALLSLFLVSACFGLSVTAQMPPQGNASVTVSVKIGVNNPGNNTGELKAEGTYTLAQNQVVDKVKIEYFSYTTVNGIPKMTFVAPNADPNPANGKYAAPQFTPVTDKDAQGNDIYYKVLVDLYIQGNTNSVASGASTLTNP